MALEGLLVPCLFPVRRRSAGKVLAHGSYSLPPMVVAGVVIGTGGQATYNEPSSPEPVDNGLSAMKGGACPSSPD